MPPRLPALSLVLIIGTIVLFVFMILVIREPKIAPSGSGSSGESQSTDHIVF